MADELDRQIMPDILQKMFAIGLGAAYKSVEMVKTPMESANKAVTEAKSMVTMPDDAGEGLKAKAEAMAGVWMEKGATWMQECQSAGEKFTADSK